MKSLQERRQRILARNRIAMVLVLVLSAALSPAVGICADARFWLSPFSAVPARPATPFVPGVQGNTRFVHIWAQPATVGTGAWDANSNPFKTLENFSLNLSANSGVIDFLDESIVVHNPMQFSGTKRFEFTRDATDGIGGAATVIREGDKIQVKGLKGFTISSGEQFSGIGPGCNSGDSLCRSLDDGSPAWRIASLRYTTTDSAGTADLFLEIGENGINHRDETSTFTNVMFGVASGPYNAGPDGDREIRFSIDVPDMRAEAVPTASEFRWKGGNGSWTDDNWDGVGDIFFDSNIVLESNLGEAIVSVTGEQVANHTQVDGGELRIFGTLSSEVTVATGGTVYGANSGVIASNLNLRGKLAISPIDSLEVFGTADITNGRLTFSKRVTINLPNSVWGPFVVLEASGGIIGSLVTPVGQHLGDGIYIDSLTVDEHAVVVQLRFGPSGDHNHDGDVDGNDFLRFQREGSSQLDSWIEDFGAKVPLQVRPAGDYNFNGRVDGEDLLLFQRYDPYQLATWTADYGKTVPINSTTTAEHVPEPNHLAVVAIALASIGLHRRPRPFE